MYKIRDMRGKTASLRVTADGKIIIVKKKQTSKAIQEKRA